MSAFQSITPLGTTASFYDWFNSYNTNAVGKLNSIYISRPYNGDGITLDYNSTSGGYTFAFSGDVTRNTTFRGNVTVEGILTSASSQFAGVAFGISGNYLSAGVTTGKVLRVTATGGLTLAIANTATGAEVLGIALSASTSETIVAVAGKISGSTLANNLISGGFSAGCVYFLDPTVAGGITKTEPTAIGQVSKPIILGLSNTEAAILPYRGQLINGICGSSGELQFNSTLYVTLLSEGETESNFGLRPGTVIATDTGAFSGNYYDSLGGNVYFKATSSTPPEKILGVVGSYVGSYNATLGQPVVLKVYPSGSVISSVTSLNNWSGLNSGVIYLNSSGLPTTSQTTEKLTIGNVSNGDLVVNINTPTQTIYSFVGSGGGAGSKNILINGSLDFWQRGIGVTTSYGITTGVGEIRKQYLADKWVMWADPRTLGYTATRGLFTDIQTEVLGYPKYYVSLLKNTFSSSTYSYFYNVIDDVRTLANKQFTFSFYARTPGGTGTFQIHSIQNISVGGNTYTNGITHSTLTTTNSNWNRYSVTFIGPTASSGITSSYSLLGIRFNEQGKTFDFAQFLLESGGTSSVPQIVNLEEEYARVAPYYQRSYRINENIGDSTLTENRGIVKVLTPPNNRVIHSFQIPMKNVPNVSIYSLSGKQNDVSLYFNGTYFDISNSAVTSFPGYGSCTRFTVPGLTSYIGAVLETKSDFSFPMAQNFCSFDEISFHYIADAETTIN
jgi:hypothetical protein